MVDSTTTVGARNDHAQRHEILIKIFDYDRSVGLWIKLSLLSRKVFLNFKHHAKDGKVKHLRHYNYGEHVSDHFVRRVLSRRIGQKLETLSFEFSAITDDHLARATFPSSLRELNFNACREISERSLVQVSEQCPNLERIELYWNCRVRDLGLKRLAHGCPKLVNVNFSGCKLLSDSGVLPLVNSCRNIEVLNLTRIPKLTDECIKVIAESLVELRELYLYANS